MTEALIRRWLIKLLKPYPIKLQPIESGGTGLGIPDLYFRTKRSGGWIELKVGKMSKDGEIKLRWEPGQLNWIKEYMELNGKTFLFVGVEPNMVMFLYLNKFWVYANATDPLIESAQYTGPMDLVSAKYIMSVLNS